MEAGCKRADMEVFASRAPELGRCAAGVLPLRGMEVWRCAPGPGTWGDFASRDLSSGGMLRARGRGDVEVWRCGAREACGPGDVEARAVVEVWSSGAPEVRGRRVRGGVEVWPELWRRTATV